MRCRGRHRTRGSGCLRGPVGPGQPRDGRAGPAKPVPSGAKRSTPRATSTGLEPRARAAGRSRAREQLGHVDVLGGEAAAQHVVARAPSARCRGRAGRRGCCPPAGRAPRPAQRHAVEQQRDDDAGVARVAARRARATRRDARGAGRRRGARARRPRRRPRRDVVRRRRSSQLERRLGADRATLPRSSASRRPRAASSDQVERRRRVSRRRRGSRRARRSVSLSAKIARACGAGPCSCGRRVERDAGRVLAREARPRPARASGAPGARAAGRRRAP